MIKKFNNVEEWFRWKLDCQFLAKNNLEKIKYPSVEKENILLTTMDEKVPCSLRWENTDVLYSFLLVYYLGLKVTNDDAFEKFFSNYKEEFNNQRLNKYSSRFLFECSKQKEFEEFNNSSEIKKFLEQYFSIGNVIPIWPGGNEARGKMGIYDIPELFFKQYPLWTKELMRQYPNAHLDQVVNNDTFFVVSEKENGRNIKGYKGAFNNLKEFENLILKDNRFYLGYLQRRNKVIELREQLLKEELEKL